MAKTNLGLIFTIYYPDQKCSIDPDYNIKLDKNNSIKEPSKEEIATNVLRYERDILIAQTDWWASSDLTMTSDQKSYRKKLRDLPANSSPVLNSDGELTNVTWPTKP